MIFSAKHLPDGLSLEPQTGRITGMLSKKGEYVVELSAKNKWGKAKEPFEIVCGKQIGLTPPMGWNSWNSFSRGVSEDKVKATADAMVASGLINHGWIYINIDDYWQVNRDSQTQRCTARNATQRDAFYPIRVFPI